MTVHALTPPDEPKKVGGRRPGAGRKPLRKTTVYRQVQAALENGEVNPVLVMLANMRFYHRRAEAFTEKLELLAESMTAMDIASGAANVIEVLKLINKVGDFRMKAQSCAVDAAPYCHPRLASIEFKQQPDSEEFKTIDGALTVKEAGDIYRNLLKRVDTVPV